MIDDDDIMRLLKTATHPDVDLNTNLNTSPNTSPNTSTVFHRKAARAIVLKGDDILMLYTKRYHDYTLPGGGIDDCEDITDGLIRELKEETGAQNITNIQAFGRYEEYRPWYKDDFDIVHMDSYCFTCNIDDELGDTQLEDYEVNNGMYPVWLNIHEAIKHNKATMANSNKKGLSIERETFLLKLIVAELLT